MKKKIISILCLAILPAVLIACSDTSTIKNRETVETPSQGTENLSLEEDSNSDTTENTETIISDSENTESTSLNEEYGQEVRLYDDLDVSQLRKIVIYYPGSTENVFTEEEDMGKFIEFLQSMHLSKTSPDERSGLQFIGDLQYRDGTINEICLRTSDSFVDDSGYYKTDRDYCDDFRALMKKLVKK